VRNKRRTTVCLPKKPREMWRQKVVRELTKRGCGGRENNKKKTHRTQKGRDEKGEGGDPAGGGEWGKNESSVNPRT